jgi:hypothetical protein
VRYRRLLQIVIAGLPATTAGCVEAVIDTDCVDTVERTYQVETPADPPLQLRIESCRVDVDACTELCRETMERNNVMRMPSTCSVRFADSSVEVEVTYEVYNGGSGCPIEDLPAGPARSARLDARTQLDQFARARIAVAREAAARELPPGPQVRGLYARTLDSIWNGGRTCHAS